MSTRLEELVLEHDAFQHGPRYDPRNDPEAIAERFRTMARARAAESPALVAWVQQGNALPPCYR